MAIENKPNIFRYPNGQYVYLESPESEEVQITPVNTTLNNPKFWTYRDINGNIYTPTEMPDIGKLANELGIKKLFELNNNLRKYPHEKPLKAVYPEFALLSLGRAGLNGNLNFLKPGSSFWTNSATKLMLASKAGALAVNLGTKAITPYKSWSEGISKNTGLPEWAADLTNPGYFIPYNLVEKGLTTLPKFLVDLSKKGYYNIRLGLELNRAFNKLIAREKYLIKNGYESPFGIIEYPNIPFSNKLITLEPSTSLKFFERPLSKISEAERLGIPKGDRYNSLKSEINWNYKDWFEAAGRKPYDRTPSQYTSYDKLSLIRNLPEYWNIEARTKKNGTFLKMPNGSTYGGDPRSWILLQSKAVKKSYNLTPIWTGIEEEINPEYNGILWGVQGNGKIPAIKARAYTNRDNGVLTIISENVPIVEYDAKGNSWTEIFGRDLGKIYTNDVVNRDFNEGIKRIHINNVKDPGPNYMPWNSKFSTGDRMLDLELQNASIPLNDVIIAPEVIRKSLVGNNGNFKLEDRNLFRKKGGSIHIKKENKGSFTKYCKGKVTNECIERGKRSSNPKIRKKAIFALNVRLFKHKFGGLIVKEFK